MSVLLLRTNGDPLPPEADVDHQRGDGCAGRGDKRTFREAGHAARCDGEDTDSKGVGFTSKTDGRIVNIW